MDIQDLVIFSRVAALQNLSAVGAELGLTPGTISKRIQALENKVNARLLERTTRKVRVTAEGRIFLEGVERALAAIEEARSEIGEHAGRPVGRLKISAPACIGARLVVPAISAFMRKFPEIDVHLDLTDKIVNLQKGGYDVAIRMGELPDSSLRAAKMVADRLIVAASPAYLTGRKMPARPDDLARHVCLVHGDAVQWTFRKGDLQQMVRVGGRMRSNNGEALRQAACDGHGVIRCSELMVASELANGRLVRLLPDYEITSEAAIWAVFLNGRHMLPKTRSLIEFLTRWLAEARTGLSPAAQPLSAGGTIAHLPRHIRRAAS